MGVTVVIGQHLWMSWLQLGSERERAAVRARTRGVALLEEVHRAAGHVAWLGEVVRTLERNQVVHGVVRTKEALSAALAELRRIENQLAAVDAGEAAVPSPGHVYAKAPEPQRKPKIFLVHGRNQDLKRQVALTLERTGEHEVVILHEQPSRGRTPSRSSRTRRVTPTTPSSSRRVTTSAG